MWGQPPRLSGGRGVSGRRTLFSDCRSHGARGEREPARAVEKTAL